MTRLDNRPIAAVLAYARAASKADPGWSNLHPMGEDLALVLMTRAGRDLQPTRDLLLDLAGCLGGLTAEPEIYAEARIVIGTMANLVAATALTLDDMLTLEQTHG